jgi:hypothetical protein
MVLMSVRPRPGAEVPALTARIEAKANLQRMLVAIPLTDEEKAAVEDGQEALAKLLEQLADVAAPDGSTPRQISSPAVLTLLPIIEVRTR